eukprot:TRINITY_DN60901_c0_g1_i1.p1 TRINITY_DN60901_c0_g1~~TRINITY_DN60901_c0_g1_i1.p1  ORF type:complete len:1083 (-),score=182.58 TRINITY_DN60901_c0_g1_i1:343-3591(-)
MEIVLDSVEGIPKGGLLSIKVGDTKRQAPVSKIGQPFRFSSSLADPMPMKVEILIPAGGPQYVKIDPATDRFEVDFGGGMRVRLQQREVKELQRPTVDIGDVAQNRGLPNDKLHMAHTAAKYLEDHDLVRTFQDMLHGLLVNKPADPVSYIEERLSRTKQLKGGATTLKSPKPPSSDVSSARGRGRESPHSKVDRMSVASQGKVEVLLTTLQMTHENLGMVLPFIPDELRELLICDDFAGECTSQFRALDTKGSGVLSPEDLIPLIEQLASAKTQNIRPQQVQRFVSMFDANEDGLISEGEFSTLMQFVIITAYLESDEGKATLEAAKMEEKHYNDFLKMIEEDKERLWAIIPFLPTWLTEHVTGDEFQATCLKEFKQLDVDGSGSLEPEELIPVVLQLCETHPLAVDAERCTKFVKVFDQHQNGVIKEDEFVQFAQFLAVMNFLTQSSEGKRIQEQADLLSQVSRLTNLVQSLQEDPSLIKEALHQVPKVLVDELTGTTFSKACSDAFVAVDSKLTGCLGFERVIPIVCRLSEEKPYLIGIPAARTYVNFYDTDKTGTISKELFVHFARYCHVMSFLEYSLSHQEMLVSDVLMGKEKIEELLKTLMNNVDRLPTLIPYLPKDLTDELMSDEFQAMCLEDFKRLDADNSGVLEPSELLPVVMQMSEVHHFSMTDDHARQFVDIFDSERNGVITRSEYVNFARFLLIMAYLETDEGKLTQQNVEKARDGTTIEEFLKMMEQDRGSVRKITSLLPSHVYDYITGDEFVKKCHERFVQLDTEKVGVLKPRDLIPLVVELTQTAPVSVTEDQCRRFTAIFDVYGDGVLRPDEFLDFARFLTIISYLHSDEGKKLSAEANRILGDSKKIDELLRMLKSDRRQIQKVLPYLPRWLHDELLSDHFSMSCQERLKMLDTDMSGALEPEELVPVILGMAEANHLALDSDQCRAFTEIFDDAGDGVIRKAEFANFCRFQMIMSYLQSQEGQKIVEALSEEAENPKPPTGHPPQLSPQAKKVPSSVISETGHLAVDREFYQKRSEKLSAENDAMRTRMQSLEEICRKMESRLEEQEMRLRHTEVDLRTEKLKR